MTPNQLFPLFNVLAMLGWLLAVLPGRPWVADRAAGVVIPAMLAAVYTGLIAANWSGSDGGFSSLPDVALLFGNPWLLLAGWVHYLGFDLLVGAWEARDARH